VADRRPARPAAARLLALGWGERLNGNLEACAWPRTSLSLTGWMATASTDLLRRRLAVRRRFACSSATLPRTAARPWVPQAGRGGGIDSLGLGREHTAERCDCGRRRWIESVWNLAPHPNDNRPR